ncbi:cell division protein SepF [Marihabitans asiaticum]|uniref:Cell division protein SepF n=1 Tax=Marihabitans asiaticum TaxID=415218 RepID=A0A560WA36_9MICO|nr:cell division protein SepF [Marihabitans asiaticum]TWD14482.1 cell division inhibitor SepF [Marihabitans asiaticum]
MGLRDAMVYLGFAEEQRYDEYDDQLVDDAQAEYEIEEAPQAAVTRLHPVEQADRRAAVREVSVGPLNRITTIHPSTYNDARAIGESFRDDVPVIMNLTDMDDADAKRLVDFAAGLVFGLHGTIERVTNKVFLLSPEHVEVAAESSDGPAARNLFNQS